MLVAHRDYMGSSEPYTTKPVTAYLEHTCDCCGHHSSGLLKPTNSISTVRESGAGRPSQVLTYPNSKPPNQRQGELPKPNENVPCCCGRYGTGSVEIVKIGEGPPLTLADLQRHGLHGGGFPIIEGSDWPQEQRKQVWKSPAPVYSEKKVPASGCGNWSQKKFSAYEQPRCHPRNDLAPTGGTFQSPPRCFHASPSNVSTGLVTTTAQTAVGSIQQPVTSQPPYSFAWQQQQQQQPALGCGGHCCSQCFAPPPSNDAWNSPSGIMNIRKIRDERKFSLPPASHHSTEQRTSYREHRFY